MVGRMPKLKPEQLANQFVAEPQEIPETPEQRRQRIMNAVQNTQSLVGDIKSGNRITRQAATDDQVMRKAYRRAVSESMSLADLAVGISGTRLTTQDVMLPDMPMPGRQMLTEEFPINSADAAIMEEYYNQPAPQSRRPLQQTIRQQLTEQQPVQRRPMQQTVSENWKTKRYLGETRSGKEVQVWKVENAKTGSSLRNLFRIEDVASRIAMMLNESGDINDPRVISLANAYEKRDKLLKEARQLEREAEGKPMKSERLRQIRAEINQLDYRLGV